MLLLPHRFRKLCEFSCGGLLGTFDGIVDGTFHVFIRHSVYFNPRSQSSASVPRHREISDITAQEICKQLDLPKIWKGK